MTPAPTLEALESGEYALLGQLTHAELAGFLGEFFLKRTSWLVWLHHAMSVGTIAAIVAVAMLRDLTVIHCVKAFGFAFLTLFLVILPVHEGLHALAYRLVGARDIRWEYSWRMAAVWVIAHRFVAGRGAFVFVALAPFILNFALILGAALWPSLTVYLLFVMLWHLHGEIGDWALLNFIWLHRRRGFWTFDDADAGKSYFYGR